MTTTTVAAPASIDVNQIASVYSGKPGCCCGCRGNHRYATRDRDWSSKHRGYEVKDDEVSDRSVSLIVGKINRAIAEGHEVDRQPAHAGLRQCDRPHLTGGNDVSARDCEASDERGPGEPGVPAACQQTSRGPAVGLRRAGATDDRRPRPRRHGGDAGGRNHQPPAGPVESGAMPQEMRTLEPGSLFQTEDGVRCFGRVLEHNDWWTVVRLDGLDMRANFPHACSVTQLSESEFEMAKRNTGTATRAAKTTTTETKATKKAAAVKEKKAPKAKADKANPRQPKAAKAPRAKKPKADAGEKKMSQIDAAAEVLRTAKAPMSTKELVAAMEAKGLWTSPGGKTPHATLYSAILRENAKRGKDARFKNVDGKFELR